MAALNRSALLRGGSIHPRDIFPSMYKRNLRKEKDIENISNADPNAAAHLPWTGK